MKKRIIIAFTLSFLLTACGKPQTVSTEADTSVQSSEVTTSETAGDESEAELEMRDETEETSGESLPETKEQSSMVNPMHKVSSSEDFKQLDLTLNMYENEAWVEVESFYIIGGNLAEINFRDKISGSDACVRAAKAELGDVSGLYYEFEDEEMKWSAKSLSGEDIDITLKVLVEGADIQGALATWTYEGTNYFLWEDNGKKQLDTVAKLAAEIAKLNTQ